MDLFFYGAGIPRARAHAFERAQNFVQRGKAILNYLEATTPGGLLEIKVFEFSEKFLLKIP